MNDQEKEYKSDESKFSLKIKKDNPDYKWLINQGYTLAKKEELKFLEKQISGIKAEIKIANEYIINHEKNNNAQQSILIYTMWLMQLNKRIKELKRK